MDDGLARNRWKEVVSQRAHHPSALHAQPIALFLLKPYPGGCVALHHEPCCPAWCMQSSTTQSNPRIHPSNRRPPHHQFLASACVFRTPSTSPPLSNHPTSRKAKATPIPTTRVPPSYSRSHPTPLPFLPPPPPKKRLPPLPNFSPLEASSGRPPSPNKTHMVRLGLHPSQYLNSPHSGGCFFFFHG